jgi:hypothetical protein
MTNPTPSSPVLPPLPEPDTTWAGNFPGDRVKFHSTDQIYEFANARVRAAIAAIAGKGDAVDALRRLERAVDLHLGRSAWTQTRDLKGFAYSEEVRKELYAAHDSARDALAAITAKDAKS